jgi:predicted metal-dependent hydrolase
MDPQLSPISWPPEYKIKKHKLARHVKLRATNTHGLEITVPRRFNLQEIPTVLEEHKQWIIKQLLQLQPKVTQALPEEIIFNACHESWKVHYVECNAKLEIIQRPNREIVLVGKTRDKEICMNKLTVWARNLSKLFLVSRLNEMSARTNLHYENVTIRNQQTLWGSCTYKKSISLNYKLVFLPPGLAQYVIIHELCHTKYLNHSERFWGLVAVHDPDWREHRRELRQANKYIPGWLG